MNIPLGQWSGSDEVKKLRKTIVSIEKRNNWKNNLIICISLIGLLASLSPFLLKTLNSSLLYKKQILDKLEKLQAGTQIGIFENAIGAPVFVNTIEEKGYKEYVFINKYFYLSALTDNSNNVTQYALTTRQKDFNPVFQTEIFDTQGDRYYVKLGVTKFNELPEYPQTIAGCAGVNYYFYYETHYLGNPGDYQYYAFGVNMSGPIDIEKVAASFEKISDTNCPRFNGYNSEKAKSSSASANIIEFRSENVINTFLVTAPFQEPILEESIGVNYQQVRIVK